MRASVQGFFTLVTDGVGWLIGSYLTGFVLQVYQITDATGLVSGHYWKNIMIVPALIALVVSVLFVLFFRDEKSNIAVAENEVAEANG